MDAMHELIERLDRVEAAHTLSDLAALPGNRSRYRIVARRARRATEVRVVVLPNDGGAHEAGISRTLKIRRR